MKGGMKGATHVSWVAEYGWPLLSGWRNMGGPFCPFCPSVFWVAEYGWPLLSAASRRHETMSGDLWASRSLMSQWPNSTGAHRISEATRFSISPATASTSGASDKDERAFIQLAHFSQPKTKAPTPRGPHFTIETRKETKKETVLSQTVGTTQRKRPW
jgi:hypothetical protein